MMGITWIMLQVCKQHQDKTLVNFIKDILGTVLGKIIVFVYFLLWFLQISMSIKETLEFLNLILLHNTPMIVILIGMLFFVVYVVIIGGITAVSRCSEVIGPFLLLSLFIQLFLNPQDMDITRILPIYADNGWTHILKGTFYSVNYMVDPSIILMLFFFAENKQSASRAILWGTATSLIWGVLTAFILVFITGPILASELVYPVYALSKFVSILNFIQNIDAFYIPLWLFGAFIKVSVCLFILSYGLSEWTGYKNWKRIALVTTLILFSYIIYSIYHIQISFSLINFVQIGIFYPFAYIITPLML